VLRPFLLFACLILVCAAHSFAARQDSCRITNAGISDWRVHLPEDAGSVERFAATELKRYVREMSGARLLDTRTPSRPRTIRIGLREDLDTSDLPAPEPGFDGYSISITERMITIAGDNPRGVLYGVYDFLERLGCRWYHPAIDPKDPEVVPKSPDLSLPTGMWSESARIEDRIYWISGLAFEIRPETVAQLDWAAKNRYNGLSWQCVAEKIDEHIAEMQAIGIFAAMEQRGLRLHGPGHSFPYFLATDKYFGTHPEWFGFRDGKRQPHGGKWPLTNFCMSNADACDEFIRNVEAFVKKHPQFHWLDLLPIDGGVPCECEECRKSTPTDLLIGLYNKLTDRLKTAAPEVIVDCVPGYGQVTNPPKEVFPNERLAAVYAHWGRNHHDSYDDPWYARKPNMLTWASYFKRFTICSYYAANSHQPFTGPPFIHALEGDTKSMVEHGITGALVLEYPFGFWWSNSFNVRMGGLYPYYYPNRAPKSELKDYALRYYGPKAGSLVSEYLLMIGSNENLERVYRASRGEGDDWDVIWLNESRSMLARAAQLAADDPVYSYRISKLTSGHDMLIRLGGSRRRVQEIEKAVAEVKEGRAKKEDVEKQIAEARIVVADLISHAEQLGAKNDGVMDAEWIKGWTINRTYAERLDQAERSLAEMVTESLPKLPERGLCAHRGAMDTHPENTLAAFREAIRVGAHMIELDAYLTKDKHLVVIHDASVDRTTDGKGKVSDLTLAEIKALDAGSWKSPEFKGERIPTLDEALEIMPLNIWLNVHLKGGAELGAAAAKAIVRHGRLHQAFLACSAEASEGARKVEPKIMICSMGNRDVAVDYVKKSIDMRADFAQLVGDIVPEMKEWTKDLKANGVRINYYGTTKADEVRALFDLGVDFPLVNNVAELMPVAAELGMKPVKPILPKPRSLQ